MNTLNFKALFKMNIVKTFVLRMWVILSILNLIPINIYSKMILFPRAKTILLLELGFLFAVVCSLPVFGFIYLLIKERVQKGTGIPELFVVIIFAAVIYMWAFYVFVVDNFTSNGSGYGVLMLLQLCSFLICAISQYKIMCSITSKV
ncbi:MAG: hypothetical protein ABI921_12260 [Panacibacter sp.]